MAVEKTMPAAVLHGPHDLRLEEVAVPEPQADEALVAITANGICGSDIHFYKEGKLGPFVVDRPYIPGHEACGHVVRPAATNGTLQEGDRVAIEPGTPCRRCKHCKTGRYNLCRSVRFLSAPPENGTFARYAAVPEDFLHPVPDSMTDEDAAMIEPFSVALQACNRAAIRPGTSFAVLGAGPIGLITWLTAAGGVVVLVGWPEISRPEFLLEMVLEKELDVRGVNRYCNTFPTAIELMHEGRVNLKPLVSHRFPFASILDAFSLTSDHPSETVKVMVAGA